MFAMVFCADFYVQCERLFKPELIGRCLVITANGQIGDAPVIASSKEARDLGIEPGLAGDHLTELFASLTAHHTISVCSPNYELYADLSSRLIKSLELLAPKVSAQACNEAVLILTGLKLPEAELSKNKRSHLSADRLNHFDQGSRLNSPHHQYAITLRNTLKQWLGLSVFIGIATTRTLAKLACDAAQTHSENSDIIDLSLDSERAAILKRIAVEDINGVSKKVANRLSQINIHTALDLSQAPKHQVRRHSSMITERIAIELSGLPCKTLEQNLVESSILTINTQIQADSLKQIKRVLDKQIASAVEQLKSIRKTCKTVTLVLAISPLNVQDPPFENSLSSELKKPVDSIVAIRKLTIQLLESLWRDGFQYQSIRLHLSGLNDDNSDQIGLFSSHSNDVEVASKKARHLLISIETRLPIRSVNIGRQKRSNLSPSFTTQWGDIVRVR